MEEILNRIYRGEEKNVVTIYSPLLRQVQKKDPMLQDIQFSLPDDDERVMESKRILDRLQGENDLTFFDRTSILGIALLLPFISKSEDVDIYEFTFFLFWTMSYRLSKSKGCKASPLPFLLRLYNQEKYLFYFPSYFEEQTGIKMDTLKLSVAPQHTPQHVLRIRKYLG